MPSAHYTPGGPPDSSFGNELVASATGSPASSSLLLFRAFLSWHLPCLSPDPSTPAPYPWHMAWIPGYFPLPTCWPSYYLWAGSWLVWHSLSKSVPWDKGCAKLWELQMWPYNHLLLLFWGRPSFPLGLDGRARISAALLGCIRGRYWPLDAQQTHSRQSKWLGPCRALQVRGRARTFGQWPL